jgi:hypothetical protein
MVAYFPLISVAVLLLFALILVVLRLIRPGFAYSWIVAAMGALIAWSFVFFSHSNISHTIVLFNWQPDWITEHSPELLLDQYSWPFAIALSTLILSAILTDVIRANETNWSIWAAGLFMGALGILAVQAGNPMTLLLLWMAIDLVELVYSLGQLSNSIDRERVIVAFSTRLAGTMLLVWSIIYTHAIGSNLEFNNIPAQTSIFLLLAAGLRLGVLPLHQPLGREYATRRNLGTLTHFVAAGASMILLVRTAVVGIPQELDLILLLLTGFAAIYASIAWIASTDEIEGRPYWILGLASLVVASAIRAQPQASLAWSIVSILSGSLLFLFSMRHKYLSFLLALGAVGLSSLPYLPIWNGVYLYVPGFRPSLALFLIAQSVLLVGYLRHAIKPVPSPTDIMRWVWLVYPWGLALLPGILILIGWFESDAPLSLATILPGLVVVVLSGIWLLVARQLRKREKLLQYIRDAGTAVVRFFSLEWIYRFLWRVYYLLRRFIRIGIDILEGDGGILWALLFVVLFVAILAQLRIME